MGNRSTSTTPGRCAGCCVVHPSIRSYLTAGGALASAGVLALGLVAAPPDVHGARTEVRAVQLAALALPPTAYLGVLEKFISNQAETVVPVTNVAGGGAADIPDAVVNTSTAGATTPFKYDSAIDPARNPQAVDAAALVPTAAAFDLGAILGPLINNSIVGPIVLFGAIAFGFLVVLPVAWFVQTVYGVIASVLGLAPVLPLPGTLTAVAEVSATTAPTLADEPLLTKSAPAATTPSGTIDVARSVDNEQADGSEPAASSESIDTGTDTTADGVSAEAASETAAANEGSATGVIEATEAEEDSTTDGSDAAEADEASTNDVAETRKADEVSKDKKGSGASEPTSGSASAASSSTGSDSSHGNSSDDGGGDS